MTPPHLNYSNENAGRKKKRLHMNLASVSTGIQAAEGTIATIIVFSRG